MEYYHSIIKEPSCKIQPNHQNGFWYNPQINEAKNQKEIHVCAVEGITIIQPNVFFFLIMQGKNDLAVQHG